MTIAGDAIDQKLHELIMKRYPRAQLTINMCKTFKELYGYVSDSKCGAKGANAKAAECTKKCIKEGAKMVVVTDGDQKVLTVDNPDKLTGHEGHHVAVTGTVSGDSMHVDSVKMM